MVLHMLRLMPVAADVAPAIERKFRMAGDCLFSVAVQCSLPAAQACTSAPISTTHARQASVAALAAEDVSVYVRVLQQIPNEPSVAADYLVVSLIIGMLSLLQRTPEANACMPVLRRARDRRRWMGCWPT